MADDIEELKARIQSLERRAEDLERETCAYSALFHGIALVHGPAFAEMGTKMLEAIETNPEAGSALQQRFTEALRIVDDIRRRYDRKPEAGKII
ncbi:hypothetical protein R1A27_28235 [Methylobacterium sp. NMS12]|uniref:hypothetical protein n=1 Tax=Methylobacterium sp. NMS12 TaxID=3079766 RepID=UPI003F883194